MSLPLPAAEPPPLPEPPPVTAAGPPPPAEWSHVPAPRPFPSSRLLVGAIVVSGTLHVAAAAILMAHARLPETGVLQTPTEAISVEMQQTIVLEAVESTPFEAAAAASAAMPEGVARPNEATPEPLSPATPQAVETGTPPPTVKAAEAVPDALATPDDPLPVIAGSAEPDAAVETRPQPRKANEEPEEERETRLPKRERTKRASARRQTAGGPTSRAQASGAKSSGRASASTGSVLSYAARVRAKVARNRPPGRGYRGTARVSFGVSLSGGLTYVRLSRSSGNSALDGAALSAVRRAAPFGPAPAGASPSQLRFSIPFYFH